jgi:hypothetical protein
MRWHKLREAKDEFDPLGSSICSEKKGRKTPFITHLGL